MITIIGDHTHSHGHSHGKPPAAPAADKKKEKSSDNEEEDDDKSTSEAKEQKTEAAPVSDAKGMCSNCKLVLLSLFLKRYPNAHDSLCCYFDGMPVWYYEFTLPFQSLEPSSF